MNISRKFIVGIIAFILLVFVAEWQMPKRFQWDPTFRHVDKQPFGCYVTDSMLAISMTQGYQVTEKTFWQLSQDTARQGILVVADRFVPTQTDFNAMRQLLKRGSTVMIVAGNTDMLVDTTLHVGINGGVWFSLYQTKKMLTEGTIQRDTVCWMGDSARYSPREFIYYSSLITGRVYCDSLITCDTLCGYWEEKGQGIYDKEGVSLIYENPHGDLNPLALSARVGRGRLILCSTPLLFTNYGMLDGRNGDFIFRMMSQFNGLPVVRTEAYLEKKLSQQSSPLSFFLTTPPLRWAVYLTLFGLLLFFVFTARRRQRVIPVMKNPDNKSLEFVCLIGTLYYQQRHHADLVRKKYLYFSETLRRELMIDVGNEAENRQNVELLSERTGLSRDTVDGYLRDVREAIAAESALKEAEMRRCIDEMNEILNKI